MAANRKSGSRSGLIHCDNCGEDYSASYRRCPFCDEYDDGYENSYESSYESPERSSSRSGGGKRLAQSQRRGGGYTKTSPFKIIGILISLAVILAAAWIVVSILRPMVQRGNVDTVDPNSNVAQNVSPDPNTSPDSTDPDSSVSDPVGEPSDDSLAPDTTPVPDDGGATGFSLHKSEFAISDTYPDPVTLIVTFTPAGTSGTITWSSSDPTVASVDENGKVSAGSKRGAATITATLSNGVTQTCTVYNQLTNPTASSTNTSQNTGTASGSYTVNNPDFTFYAMSDSYQLKVNGYTGGVTWSSSNTSIATVSSDGTCKPAGSGKGSCTVTGTLDNGSKVEAIVRINIS